MKKGRQTIEFKNAPAIAFTSSVVGPKEGEGPLLEHFDVVSEDISFGEDTWEKSESKILLDSMNLLMKKSELSDANIDLVIAGDLQNQATGSTFGLRTFDIPYLGIFSACASYSEAMLIAASLIDGGYLSNIVVAASSHFCSAEKTFRTPLALGTQRSVTSSWTVTGSGTALISNKFDGPRITSGTFGVIKDYAVKDPSNMAAAMAPAAASTIKGHLMDMKRDVGYYDLILTGDLGHLGTALLIDLLEEDGIDISKNHKDCGIEIFDMKAQQTHNGGSGPACTAVVFNSYFYKKLLEKEIGKMLYIPTGALLSQVSALQGESIPAIAHAVSVENYK